MFSEEDMRRVVRETVHETLNGIGINASNPHEMQADFIYVRKMRKGAEFMSRNVRASIITVTIPTMLYMLWESLRHVVSK